jgi:hypothetical protein
MDLRKETIKTEDHKLIDVIESRQRTRIQA